MDLIDDGLVEGDPDLGVDIHLRNACRYPSADILVGHARAPVHDQRNRHSGGDLCQPAVGDMWSAAKQPVGGADGDGQHIDACLRHEAGRLLGIGEMVLCPLFAAYLAEAADLRLHRDSHGVSHRSDAARHLYVLLIRSRGLAVFL